MTTERERDTALAITKNLANAMEKHGTFVLTGSYSIDALTKGNIHHNDIDANLFVTGISVDRTREIDAAIFQEMEVVERTLWQSDRLEYIINSNARQETAELQLVEYSKKIHRVGDDVLVLSGANEAGNEIRVPLSTVELMDSREKVYEFKVKSLSYAIATWAIRISGIINYQKRPVRQTDIDHFAVLLNQSYDLQDVYSAIDHHPQMVAADPDIVLDKAIKETK